MWGGILGKVQLMKAQKRKNKKSKKKTKRTWTCKNIQYTSPQSFFLEHVCLLDFGARYLAFTETIYRQPLFEGGVYIIEGTTE